MLRPLLLTVSMLTAAGCVTAPPPKGTQSSLQVQSYQTRDFETTKRRAFNATMSVLQDAGFIVESADFETGFITGQGFTTSRPNFFFGPLNEATRMTATVQQRGEGWSSVRINIVETSQRKSMWNTVQDVINERGVRDPRVYQDLFEQIDKAVFVEKSLQ